MIGGMAWGNDKTSPPLTDHEQQKKSYEPQEGVEPSNDQTLLIALLGMHLSD